VYYFYALTLQRVGDVPTVRSVA